MGSPVIDIASKKPVMIPRLPNGSIPHYVGYRDKVKYEPVEDFHAVLQLVRTSSGRSAVTFFWRNVHTGAEFPMAQSWFNVMLEKAEWVGPLLVDGRWRPVKRGSNYLIQPVFPEDVK